LIRDSGEKTDLIPRVSVGPAGPHVDDAENLVAGCQRNREHALVLLFVNLREILETMVLRGVADHGYVLALPSDPAGDSLAEFQSDLPHHTLGSFVGSAEDQ